MSSTLDQLRQLAALGEGDLVAALAQLGLDVGEAEALVDGALVLALGDLAALDVGDPVLGDREPHPHGALAELDVVLLRAR